MIAFHPIRQRTGAVYIAVLGTALVISTLAMSALLLQRIQNRQLASTADMRQAQLNAEAAVDVALLAIKQDKSWRTTYTNGNWFSNRSTGTGTCAVDVVDPIDANLADDPAEPVVITGVGTSGRATQRIKLTVDSWNSPLSCLRSGIAAGNLIDMSGDVLRSSGPISASQVSASSSTIYGDVTATTVSGSTFVDSTSQVTANKLPELPDWSTVFNYYRTSGTQININDLPSVTPNLGRNTGIESGTTYWSGSPVYSTLGSCTITQSTAFQRGGANSLQVSARDYWYSGPVQYIDTVVKASTNTTSKHGSTRTTRSPAISGSVCTSKVPATRPRCSIPGRQPPCPWDWSTSAGPKFRAH